MLADENVEAVIVAIADQFHVPMAIRALEAGKPVLVEKPVGDHVAECERLRDVVRARLGVHVQVGTRECPASPCRDTFPRRGRLGTHTGRAAVSRVPRQRRLGCILRGPWTRELSLAFF
jgi:Oxidoreductase family, NAD-binding Rossmann fold